MNVREVSGEDAPVAALVPGSPEFRTLYVRDRAELRVLDGLIYQQLVDVQHQPVRPHSQYVDNLNTHFGTHSTRGQALDSITAEIGRFLVIDGWLWKQVDEPFINVSTYGQWITVYPGPPARSNSWLNFALGERDTVAATAAALAARRQREAPAVPEVEILIPEAFTYPTSAERVAAAQREAEEAARLAMEMLAEVTPFALNSAHTILMAAASTLAEHTGLNQFGQE